jgi:hypothetical protein
MINKKIEITKVVFASSFSCEAIQFLTRAFWIASLRSQRRGWRRFFGLLRFEPQRRGVVRGFWIASLHARKDGGEGFLDCLKALLFVVKASKDGV